MNALIKHTHYLYEYFARYNVLFTLSEKQDGTPYISLTSMYLNDELYSAGETNHYVIDDSVIHRIKSDKYDTSTCNRVSELISEYTNKNETP